MRREARSISTNEFAPPGDDVTITTPIVMGVGHEGTPQPPTARYAHDLIGVWEVTFVVPGDASSGDNPLNIGIPDPTNNNKLILNKRGSIIPISNSRHTIKKGWASRPALFFGLKITSH